MPHAQCPMPNAPCPMPHAPCPMPHAQCPMPNAQSLRFPTTNQIKQSHPHRNSTRDLILYQTKLRIIH